MTQQNFSTEELRSFATRTRKTNYIPSSEKSYNKLGFSSSDSVRENFTLDQVKQIIEAGNPTDIRELSRYYYRTSGLYSRAILFLSTLLTYDYVMVPKIDAMRTMNGKKIQQQFSRANAFVDSIHTKAIFAQITASILINGVYYGILREGDNSKHTIQELPLKYCRTRFKNFDGLSIPEFNIDFFTTFSDEPSRLQALSTYPKSIKKGYMAFKEGKTTEKWIEIPIEEGGMCFFYLEKVPFLLSSIPSLYELDEAKERESKRDTNELYKLLIQKMPFNSKTGELVFSLPEVTELHDSISSMLSNNDNIDVLTTFGDVSLENVQDSDAASSSQDRLNKYKTSSYDDLGISNQLFNSTGDKELAFSINKDIALMSNWCEMYAIWIESQVNQRFAIKQLYFSFEFLPVSIFNKTEITKNYFEGAKYGYSKLYAAGALGIKQSNFMSLLAFENEILGLPEKMIPLQSSYTSSGKDIVKEEKKLEKEEKKEEKIIGDIPDEDLIEEEKNGGRTDE